MTTQGSTTKIAIVGSGNVGTTFAYALLLSGLAAEILLIDNNQAKAEGEVMDLNHAVPLTYPTLIRSGTFSDTAGAAITVITAGSAQKPGETRLELGKNNTKIFKKIIPEIARQNPDGIILVATNPVDVLTFAAWKLSNLPSHRVIGSGTILDTARFRHLLSRHFSVDARSVHAFIIGEHGDSEVPIWSLANIAGMRLEAFSAMHGIEYNEGIRNDIFSQTRSAAYEIIRRKGATFYAVAVGLLRIVEAILRDQKTVYSVSSLVENYYSISNTYLSLPSVIGRNGVEFVLQLQLDDSEGSALRKSGEILQTAIKQLDLE